MKRTHQLTSFVEMSNRCFILNVSGGEATMERTWDTSKFEKGPKQEESICPRAVRTINTDED